MPFQLSKAQLNSSLEQRCFALLVVLHFLPVLSFRFFHTLDGPSHLYNASLIKHLLLGNDAISRYFTINPIPVPNWIGHGMLGASNLILPAFLSEKLLLAIYFFGMPYAFRALVKAIDGTSWSYYLIFPFLYSFPLFLGFYNFCISLVILMATLAYWFLNERAFPEKKSSTILFLLFLLLYFSHPTSFIIALSVVLVRLLILLNRWKTLAFTAVIAFPLLLLCLYFFQFPKTSGLSYISKPILIRWLEDIRPLIAYSNVEERYTRKIFYVLAAVTGVGLWYEFISIRFSRKGLKQYLLSSKVFWAGLVSFLILAYFLLPDSSNVAGFISVRTGLLCFLFLLVFISLLRTPAWLQVSTICLLIGLNALRLSLILPSMQKMSRQGAEIEKASRLIPENATVLPLNYTGNWLMEHASAYLGLHKPIIILNNYEAGTRYFPLKWNKNESFPQFLLGKSTVSSSCMFWESNKISKRQIPADYVFLFGSINNTNDTCLRSVLNEIQGGYQSIYSSGFCALYRLK